ncbi:MAG: glutamyl-tRNA reductase [Bacteroidetes bacterium]|nr:glutamyl-tRNA reductase [Bacteroidota bacterium]MDA1119407.1 glutamyl-tRNA reductase [Bacteroidota bacterium]
MHSDFRAVGISYKNAPISVRELFALDEASCRRLLQFIGDLIDITEALVLSTCNRTEVYYSSSRDQSEDLIKLLTLGRELKDINQVKEYFVRYNDRNEATRHLFDVAAGLEAQVTGDLQIINQVKNAYQWAADENLAGPFMHRLLHSIFFTNKRIVQETPFRDGAASVSYAAVELIDGLVKNFNNPQILVLGIGDIGEDVCKNLKSIVKADVFVSNRTEKRAREIARECSFNIIPYKGVCEKFKDFDVIVSSVATEQLLITKDLIGTDTYTFRYLLDLSVPRSISEDVEEIPGVILFNIDGIQDKASTALEKRMSAIPAVSAIIQEAVSEFNNWTKEMEVSPTINKLKNALEQIRREEIARYLKNNTEKESEIVDKITKSMVQKIIKLPVLQLKAACRRGEAETLIDVLNDLFDLEKHPEKLDS